MKKHFEYDYEVELMDPPFLRRVARWSPDFGNWLFVIVLVLVGIAGSYAIAVTLEPDPFAGMVERNGP